MRIKRQVRINASAAEVWRVLGTEFDSVHHWASSVSHSAARTQGRPIGNAPCAGRTCQTDLGPFTETIIEYDDQRLAVAYEAQGDKMPFFVKRLTNRWAVSGSTTSCTVEMDMNADLMLPFIVMSPMMKMQMGKIATFAVEELKHYVEHGEPHPRKVEATRKSKQKAA
ncbi:MAG: SRPBCC family protein [Planctomycetota bacterium]